MSTRFRLDFVVWATLLCGCGACAQEPSVEAFRQELIEPIQIFTALIDSDRIAQLSASQRESLLRARAGLGEFFRSLERAESDPRQFMTDEYVAKMGDAQSIRQTFVAYETTIHQIRVTEFSLLGEDALELFFYITVFSEGTVVVGDARATLRRVGEAWRLNDVVILYP
jgi:hypothetical protein